MLHTAFQCCTQCATLKSWEWAWGWDLLYSVGWILYELLYYTITFFFFFFFSHSSWRWGWRETSQDCSAEHCSQSSSLWRSWQWEWNPTPWLHPEEKQRANQTQGHNCSHCSIINHNMHTHKIQTTPLLYITIANMYYAACKREDPFNIIFG